MTALHLSEFPFFFREAGKALKLHPASNAISVACISLALLCLGFLVGAGINAERVLDAARAEAEIVIYLSSHASLDDANELLAILKSDPSVTSTRVVTPEESMDRVESILGKGFNLFDLMDDYNPFALAIEVGVLPESAPLVAGTARDLPGVDAVRDNEEVLAPLASITRVARWIGAVVTLAVILVTLVLVSHIVRLSISARSDEMETLRLLGASEWFVSVPFLMEGALLGGMGSLSCLVVSLAAGPGLYGLLQTSLPFLPWVSWVSVFGSIFLVVLPLGILAGTLGSIVALRTS